MKAPSLFARLKSPRTPATPDDARDQPRPQTAPNPRTPPTLDTTVISTPKLVLTSDTADSPTTFHFSTPDSLHRPSSAILPSPPRKSADYERGRERPAPSRHSIHEIVSSDGTRTSFQLTESPIALTTPTGPTREHYFAENSPPLSPPAHVQLTSQSRTSTATPPPMLRNNTLRPARPVSPVYTPEPVYAMRNSSASIRSSSATRGAAAVHDRPDSSSGLPTTGRHSHYSAMITRIPSNQSLYERSVASAAAAALVPATPPPRRRDSIASARSDLSSSFPQSQSQPHSLPDKDANTQHTPPPPLVRSPPIDARDFHPRNTSTPVRSASISVVSPSPAPGASAASKRAGGKGHAKALSHDTGDLLFASGSLHALSANNTINGSNAPNGMTGTNGLNGSNGNSNGGSLNATTKTRWKRGNSVSQQQQQPPPGLAGGIASAMVAAGMIMPQVQPHIHAHMPLSPKETPSQNQVAGQPGKEKKEKEKKEKGRVRGSSAASQRQNSNETNGYEGGGQRRSMDGRPPSVFTSASARSRSARASVSISSPRAPRSELFPHDGASSVNANVNDEHEDDGYRDRNGDNEDNEDDNEDSDEDEDEGDGDGDGDGGMSPYGLSFDQIDIPVTGFAVASSKRNADFHELFPSVAEGDYLIEDYGCALQREILIQGRIYISENHMCFRANIFGWVTNHIIPFADITRVEKKMTAFVIPNAIQVTTRETKYAFASFLSRDTAFDVIYNIWRLACPDPLGSGVGSSASVGFAPSVALTAGSAGLAPTAGSGGGPGAGGGTGGAEVAGLGLATGAGKKQQHRATTCRCEAHLEETVMDCVLPGSPERIYNLMFASGFIKNFMAGEQKLTEIQISDWRPEKTGSHLLTRNMSYIKPLTGTFGPRQAKCELTEETLYVDFDDYVCTLTTTRTPEVPSGGVFAVKTRTCIMWAGGMSSRVLVTTAVEWTGRSFVKSIIERSALDGQRTYHADLEASMRAYVLAHRTEFFPDGEDEETAATVENATSPTAEDTSFQSPSAGGGARTPADDKRARLKETEQRGLQWALDTATGTARVAHNSFWGAIDLLGDLFESVVSTGAGAGSSTPGVGAVLGMLSSVWAWVVIVLVVSNVWMVVSLRGANKRETKAWRWARLEKAIVETRAPAEFPPGMANPVGNEVPPLGPGGGAAPVAGGGAVPTEAVRVLLEELVAAKQRAAPEHWSAILGEEKTCVKDEVVRLRHTLDAIEGQVRRLRDTLPLPGTMMDCVD